MTEQAILNTIPDDWADDIDQELLQKMAEESETTIVTAFAEQLGVKTGPFISVDEMIRNIAKKQGVSELEERDRFKRTCYNSAKMDIFFERYGHLFKKGFLSGDYSYSKPMIRKITGLPV